MVRIGGASDFAHADKTRVGIARAHQVRVIERRKRAMPTLQINETCSR
jgi:hypothetical protein